MKIFNRCAAFAVLVLSLSACTNDPDSPGLEYMPDMYRSPAIEAYVDYGQDPYQVTEDTAMIQRNTPSAMKPVDGSIAFAGEDARFSMPYKYPNTTEGYEAAGIELTSPIPFNQANLEKGIEIYEVMCTHCHGEKGEGKGAIATNGKIAGIPSYSGKLKDLPVGKMYHTLQWGKGLMGSHASQINQKERWQVIQYIMVLQKGGEMPEFDDEGNLVEVSSNDVPEEQVDSATADPATDDTSGDPTTNS
ncbi:MAG: cytochrome c [Bacteroidota bacterium]